MVGLDDRYAYLCGGASQGKWCACTFRYDSHADTYEEVVPMMTARRRAAAAIIACTAYNGGSTTDGGRGGKGESGEAGGGGVGVGVNPINVTETY